MCKRLCDCPRHSLCYRPSHPAAVSEFLSFLPSHGRPAHRREGGVGVIAGTTRILCAPDVVQWTPDLQRTNGTTKSISLPTAHEDRDHISPTRLTRPPLPRLSKPSAGPRQSENTVRGSTKPKIRTAAPRRRRSGMRSRTTSPSPVIPNHGINDLASRY